MSMDYHTTFSFPHFLTIFRPPSPGKVDVLYERFLINLDMQAIEKEKYALTNHIQPKKLSYIVTKKDDISIIFLL